MALGPGTKVTSNVRLIRLLGEGGMGSVWVAEHKTLGTQVAVKFIDPDLADAHPVIRSRFTQEANVSAIIKSPHVVRVFDHGEMDEGVPYIVMELLEGESLRERLERAGPLSLSEAGELLFQASKALRKAHKLGIIHRDLKPENLFLLDSGIEESDGEPVAQDLFVKILDFGIAKHRKASSSGVITITGALIGTPEYMSPEQIFSAKDVDRQADLWALSVVIYEAITGYLPFSGDGLSEVFQAIAKGKFEPASAILYDEGRLSVSEYPELDQWFAKAMHLVPEERFQTARSMAVGFSQVLPASVDDFHKKSTERPPAHDLGSDPGDTLLPETPKIATGDQASGSELIGLEATCKLETPAELDKTVKAGPSQRPSPLAAGPDSITAPIKKGSPGSAAAKTAAPEDEPAGIPLKKTSATKLIGSFVSGALLSAVGFFFWYQNQKHDTPSSAEATAEPTVSASPAVAAAKSATKPAATAAATVEPTSQAVAKPPDKKPAMGTPVAPPKPTVTDQPQTAKPATTPKLNVVRDNPYSD